MTKAKKIITLLLVFVLLFSSFNFSAFAVDEICSIRYNAGLEENFYSPYFNYRSDETVTLPTEFAYCLIPENYAFIGWSDSKNGDIIYDGGEAVSVSELPRTLYARWCELQLNPNEVFDFRNSSYYFNADGKSGYYLTKADNRRIHRNLFKNFGLGPVPGILVSMVLAFYPDFEFNGSCYGMSSATVLQHFGLIDIKSLQNADYVRELSADDELISFINYYQAQAASSFLCENKAFIKNSENYKKQLKKMFESVSQGNIVLFTRYDGNAFVSSGHTVVLTGGYDDSKGNHILIAYDSNRPFYYSADRYYSRYIINEGFDSITEVLTGKTFGAFNWTDSFEHFKSFDINGNGNPSFWYKAFFKHIIELK